MLQAATGDRRLAKSHVSVHMGGAAAAVAHYHESPTPNLIIIETSLPRAQMLAELDRLAECCDAGTKVVVIGHTNDVVLYRELLKRGVSEYLVAPITPLQLIESLSNLYNNPDTDPVGNVIAFIGAKGGVGSSTVCHNAAWAMSEILKSNVVVADLDLAFGTTGLDFNQDPVQGIAEALAEPGAARRGAARPPADQVLRAPEHLRRPGRARPRLRDLGRRLRPRARGRAPERALRRRRSAAHLDAVGRSACCCRPMRSSSPPCPISPTCATPRTSSIC